MLQIRTQLTDHKKPKPDENNLGFGIYYTDHMLVIDHDEEKLECVPNFSEGRDLQKIDKIVAPFRGKQGVKLLDYSNDEDHKLKYMPLIRIGAMWFIALP